MTSACKETCRFSVVSRIKCANTYVSAGIRDVGRDVGLVPGAVCLCGRGIFNGSSRESKAEKARARRSEEDAVVAKTGILDVFDD